MDHLPITAAVNDNNDADEDNVKNTQIKVSVQENGFSEQPADFEKAIAETGFGKFNYILLVAIIPCAWSSVFDTTTMSLIFPYAECDLQLTSYDKGILNAMVYAGMITSAFMWGFLSDILGRRRLLVHAYIADGIINALSIFSYKKWLLMLFKFASGFVICGPFAMLMTYLAEFHGAKYRSTIIMSVGMYYSTASMILPVLAYLILPLPYEWDIGSMTLKPWRLFILVCSLPSLVAGIVMSLFPESPKFLMTTGRNEDALKIFQKIYKLNSGNNVSEYSIKRLVDEKAKRLSIIANQADVKPKSLFHSIRSGVRQFTPLCLPPHLARAALIFTIQLNALCGLNTIRLWLPQIFSTIDQFTNKHIEVNRTGVYTLCDMLTQLQPSHQNITLATEDCVQETVNVDPYINNIIVGAVAAVTYLPSSCLVRVIGKKVLMVISYLIAGICVISMHWAKSMEVTLALSSTYLAVLGVCNLAIIGATVELFPTKLRTMAVSILMMFGRIGALLGNLLFPVLLNINCSVPFFSIGCIILGCSALSILLPVNKSKALE